MNPSRRGDRIQNKMTVARVLLLLLLVMLVMLVVATASATKMKKEEGEKQGGYWKMFSALLVKFTLNLFFFPYVCMHPTRHVHPLSCLAHT